MNFLIILAFVFSCSGAPLHGSELGVDRKVWSNCDSNGNCTCGVPLGKSVLCSNSGESLLVQPCYCLYYDSKIDATVAGPCLFSCFYSPDTPHDYMYSLPRYSVKNFIQFNNNTCNSKIQLNRRGRFCGRCEHDYGFPVYSYNIECIPCQNVSYTNWFKYLTITLVPLTVFYTGMVTFRASMPTSHLNGMLFVIQCIISPLQVRVFHAWTTTLPLKHEATSIPIKIIFSVLGVANLDFFREVYPKFCLNPTYKILHVIALDLLSAVYPFLLILLTYWLISLYDRNYYLIVFVWKKCQKVLNPVLKNSVQVSLAETFATFILLSSVKVMGLSYDLLKRNRAYKENGSDGIFYVYYDAEVEYLSKEHAIPALLAILSSLVIVIFPLLLLFLYPSRFFQRLLNRFNIRSHALHIFMDAFQGSFKTEPYDLRYFAAWYLFLRFLFLLFVGYFNSSLAMTTASIVMIIGALSVAIVRPYQNNRYNIRDLLLLLSAALFYLSTAAVVNASLTDYNNIGVAQPVMIFSVLFIIFVLFASMFWCPISRTAAFLYAKLSLRFRRSEHTLDEVNYCRSYDTFNESVKSKEDE